jgi:predicted TIM-barrel fold metal-dependent hydrolase
MAACLRRLYYDLAGTPVPTLLTALLNIADPQKIFYGSDWPFTPIGAAQNLAAKIDETPLIDSNMRQAILSGNAVRLFPQFTR